MRLFDAHCHLQDERLAPHLDAALARARAAGVERFMCCGSSEQDWPAVAALAERHEGVVPSFGLHPWYVKDRSENWKQTLHGFLDKHNGAVGEAGLDHGIDDRDDAEQEEVFIAQLGMARELSLPVSIHCRRAWGRMIGVLQEFGRHDPGLVFHAFSGAPDVVDELTALGGYFSFCGTVARSNNKRGHRAAAAIPLDRLLIETDSPDLPPPHPDLPPVEVVDGKPVNEPANLPCVLRAIAEIRGITEEEVAHATWTNATRVFGTEGESK